MPWVFSFSELGPQDVENLLKKAPFCSLPASLENYQVVFKGKSRKWGGGIANIEKKKGSVVYGSALLVSGDELKYFDRYFVSYVRTPISITLDATKDVVKAYTYIIEKEAPYATPSAEYEKAMVKHLRFFWGQPDNKNPTLQDFGISTVAISKPKTALPIQKSTVSNGSIEELLQTPTKRGRPKKEATS